MRQRPDSPPAIKPLMSILGRSLQRLRRLDRGRQRLLVRAALLLTTVSAMVALLPFRTAIGFGTIRVGDRPTKSVGDCVWAIEAAARRLPWRTMCIEKAIAVQRLLRGAGIDAILHYGARNRSDGGKLEAHVWVSVAEEIVMGGEEAPTFAEITNFP